MGRRNTPWYYQAWFLCILFAFWQSIFTVVIGVILLILSARYNKKVAESIDQEYLAMHQRLAEYGDYEIVKESYEKELEALDQRNKEIQASVKAATQTLDFEEANQRLREEKQVLIKDIEALNHDYFIGSVFIEAYETFKSDEIKNELQLLRIKQDSIIKGNQAFIVKDSARSQKVIDIQKKQLMRCYNSETVSIIESVTVKNIDTCRNKLQRTFENLNKLFIADDVAISEFYHKTKLEELSMVYAYMVKQEEERELQREIREQLKEEEKVRREIEQAKSKIEKEEAQFQGEVAKLMGYMQKASEVEKQLYVDKIRELEEKLKGLEKDKENVLEREQNTRAGFVYIISNIGSFGENVYKIGMTRRLEPMDRVKELGDASVPFTFDVHAMIFSADAPALETVLHQTFREFQINKVNPRKEFFRIDLERVKKVVKENHNATVHFIDEPEAAQYRESKRMEIVVV